MLHTQATLYTSFFARLPYWGKYFIKQIAVNNGYDSHLIDQLVNKKRQTIAFKSAYPTAMGKNPKPYISFSYIGIGTPSNKIKQFSPFNSCTIAFKTRHNLGRFIKNNKSRLDKDDKCGVY